MSSAIHSAPLFSSSQRRCHLLLLLYLPSPSLAFEQLCQLNGADEEITRQDIAAVQEEIRRYHQLDLHWPSGQSIQLRGAELNRRICLLQTLRRGLRLSPEFVEQHFVPTLRQTLSQLRVDKALYDEKNLQALIAHCSHRLQRTFSSRDAVFLQLYMQFMLCQPSIGEFSASQLAWLASKPECDAAQAVIAHWKKRCQPAPAETEVAFWTLLFSLLHAPDASRVNHHSEQKLLQAIEALIERFEARSGMRFRDRAGLSSQLYTHMAQALDRSHFAIGIDNSLTEEVTRLYPRLLRTTHDVLQPFAGQFQVTLTAEETGLIAVIFGAWLMQENVMEEKQVLLLTGEDEALEREIEQQVREMTLLPLSIKYQSMQAFQQHGAPKEVALVITPYATALPLFSPPLIHAELPLTAHQQQRIRLLLEA